jgi:catechol 2,3-dioxygenase-like lactoylglutathione lyase family enzyme
VIEISKTHHFSFTVGNVEKSIEFYRDFLGFNLKTSEAYPNGIREERGNYVARVTGYTDAHLRMAVLEKDGCVLELVEYAAPRSPRARAPETFEVGCPHVAFVVEDLEKEFGKILEARQQWDLKLLSERVIEIDSGPNRGGKAVYFRDPDGITIELAEMRK